MAVQRQSTLMYEILDFLASTPTPEQIIDFKPSAQLVERSRYLLEQNRNGMLTSDEREELDEFGRMNHFMGMLKIRARQKVHTV